MHGTGLAKIILIGEHSVVYGHPALALPFKHLQSNVILSPSASFILKSKYYEGDLEKAQDPMHGMKVLIKQIINDYPHITPVTITLTSNIPEKSGLGSSASIAKAIIAAFDNYFALNLTKENYFNYLQISENIYHAKASGIDAATIINELPIKYAAGKTSDLTLNVDAYLMVVSSNSPSSTKDAVLSVRNDENRDYHISNLAKYTKDAENALKNNEVTTLGELFNKAHVALRALKLSTPLLEELRTTLLNNGALGVKITGGGMGGCLIALFPNEKTALAANEALGTYDAWILNLRNIE